MKQPQTLHLKGLNGIRAIAALMVVIFHIFAHQPSFNLPALHVNDFGGNGVTIFFALSGFLITYLLIIEKESFFFIHIRSFYLRRVFRIWPLYYLYLLVSFIAMLLFKTKPDGNIFYYVFLMGNIPMILEKSMGFIGHYWSIAVEEQFYLFWPLLFLFPLKNLGRRLLILLTIFLILKIYFFSLGANRLPYKTLFFTRFECMIAGGLAAWYFYFNPLFFNFLEHKIVQLILWVFWIVFSFDLIHFYTPLNSFILAIVTSLFIIMNINAKKQIIDLENPVADFLGKISYGIYVWQAIVLVLVSKVIKRSGFTGLSNYVIVYTGCIGLTILLAYLSYRFYEKKFLILKERFAFIKSIPSKAQN